CHVDHQYQNQRKAKKNDRKIKQTFIYFRGIFQSPDAVFIFVVITVVPVAGGIKEKMECYKNQDSRPNFQIFDKSQGEKKNGQQKNRKTYTQVKPTGFFKHNGIIMEAFFTYLNQA